MRILEKTYLFYRMQTKCYNIFYYFLSIASYTKIIRKQSKVHIQPRLRPRKCFEMRTELYVYFLIIPYFFGEKKYYCYSKQSSHSAKNSIKSPCIETPPKGLQHIFFHTKCNEQRAHYSSWIGVHVLIQMVVRHPNAAIYISDFR